jgi:ElaB/YqjD/DUF883 family membrane-anchored ribosome-binding protein
MDWDTIELNWERYKKLAREKWHKIPDDVFQSVGGSRQRLIGAIEHAYKFSLEQAEQEVNHWAREAPRVGDAMAEEFARSRSRAAAEFKAIAGATSSRVTSQMEQGRQRLADLREQAGTRGELALDQALDRARGQMRAHPATMIALAVGVGLLLGQLMTRRR